MRIFESKNSVKKEFLMKNETQMLLTKKKAAPVSWLVVYIVFVCAASGLNVLVIGPHLAPLLAHQPLGILFDPLWQFCVRILPALLYIRYVEHQPPLVYLKLKTRVGWGVLWGGVLSVLALGVMVSTKYLLLHQPFQTHTLTPDELLNQVLLIGFTEEIPFRGLVFQKLQELLGFWLGAVLAGLIFVELHLVFWIAGGRSPLDLLSGGLTVFLFALISCTLLSLTRSLWGCILLHSTYNFLSIVF